MEGSKGIVNHTEQAGTSFSASRETSSDRDEHVAKVASVLLSEEMRHYRLAQCLKFEKERTQWEARRVDEE